MNSKNLERIFQMPFASVYPHYITKAEKKGRTKAEVDEIIEWLTGYNEKKLIEILENKTNFEIFLKMQIFILMQKISKEKYADTKLKKSKTL